MDTKACEYRPLFARYPRLKETLPHILLGKLPTPVQRLENLERALGIGAPAIYIKRDDLSGEKYGGNKVRKLEFLLGSAIHQGRRTVLTFGAAGSNHALATALYAEQLGLRCISMLVPQPNAVSVRHNLLLHFKSGAELHHFHGIPSTAAGSIGVLLRDLIQTRQLPYLIPPGGSSPAGLAGFVNAGFELQEQIDAGMLPVPDCVYAASGTMGTAVGLAMGLQAAGLNTQLMAVRVTDAQYTSPGKAKRLHARTNRLLRNADPEFPSLTFPEDQFQFRHEFFGNAYGLYTVEGMRAVRMLWETEGIKVEGTYTGKTLAALLADIGAGQWRGKTVLFWNTYNARDFSAEIASVDYRALPRSFYRYFEEEVQPLDH